MADPVDDLDPFDPDRGGAPRARERYDLVVIGPEAPLAVGVADALVTASVPVFGPGRAAARLETSKAFAKEVMARAGVATAASAVFRDPDAALAHARRQTGRRWSRPMGWPPARAWSCPTLEEAEAAINAQLAGPAAEGGVVLEERLDGPRGVSLRPGQRRGRGPAGGGLRLQAAGRRRQRPEHRRHGGVQPRAVVRLGRAGRGAVAEVFEPVAWRMARDGTPYRGVLYAGMILTAGGPMVLEFNARFGDPEAQVVLPLLDGELANALLGVARGDRTLMEGSVALRRGQRWAWCSPRKAIRRRRRSAGR